MNKDKEIIELLRKQSQHKIDNCKECDNTGEVPSYVICQSCNFKHGIEAKSVCCAYMDLMPMDFKPCEKCSPIRELDLKWYENCKHKWGNKTTNVPNAYAVHTCSKCSICGFQNHEDGPIHSTSFTNPDLTTAMHGSIPLVVHWMQVLGIWREFELFIELTYYAIDGGIPGVKNIPPFFTEHSLIEILINREHLRDAIASFLAGRADNAE